MLLYKKLLLMTFGTTLVSLAYFRYVNVCLHPAGHLIKTLTSHYSRNKSYFVQENCFFNNIKRSVP